MAETNYLLEIILIIFGGVIGAILSITISELIKKPKLKVMIHGGNNVADKYCYATAKVSNPPFKLFWLYKINRRPAFNVVADLETSSKGAFTFVDGQWIPDKSSKTSHNNLLWNIDRSDSTEKYTTIHCGQEKILRLLIHVKGHEGYHVYQVPDIELYKDSYSFKNNDRDFDLIITSTEAKPTRKSFKVRLLKNWINLKVEVA